MWTSGGVFKSERSRERADKRSWEGTRWTQRAKSSKAAYVSFS